MARRKSNQKIEIPAVGTRGKIRAKKKRAQVAVFSTHKRRSEWFRDRAAWPMREASMLSLVRARRVAQRRLPEHPAAANKWHPVGPSNIGGRMTSAVVDPRDADRIWAGAAGGGVWFSADAGAHWRPLWHRQDSLNVGSLAIDPNDPDVIYCGTGEANLSADSYPGVGLYRSTNAGRSWSLIAKVERTGIPPRIGAIAVDPFDSNHVLLGGVAHHFPGESTPGGRGGLYESTNAGVAWTRLNFISLMEYRCHAIVFHPSRQGTIYVTVTEQGIKNGIWRTADGGATWVQLTEGLPSTELFDRTSLAIAPSRPDVLYALVSDADSAVLGVFRSDDGGDSWTAIHGTSAFHYRRRIGGGNSFDEGERQMTYNNTIAVHPQDEDHVICGGVDLHLSVNGGGNWKLVTKWENDPGDSDYAHADHHALVMPASKPGRVYDLNDGGLDVSEDGGRTWTNRSNGLAVTMFYDLDVAQSNSNVYGGGAQDNGTLITEDGQPDTHFDITGGDGGWIVFDPQNENHLFASIYNMNIFRFPKSATQQVWADVSPSAPQAEKDDMWMVYIAMDPSNSKRLFTGSRRVWRTKNDGNTWTAVSPFFQGEITAIEICAADPNRIYVATSHGEIMRSTDGGTHWTGDLSSAAIPKSRISRVRASPTNADHVIVTVANFAGSHVFRSLDGGLSWTDITGDLPNAPHNSIAIPSQFPNEVYVASDAGVFVSGDFGNSWASLTGNLPNVSVVDIVYHDAENTLTAATYGRSHWRIQIR